MSSQAEQPSLVLTRRLPDGAVEWIPLDIPQRVPAAPEADYALIDRAEYEAPQTLMARRQGEDLVVEVQGTEVLVLDGFFATPDVAFYPTTDIAGGAGPFSGSPLTADSPVQPGSPAGEQVVWSAEPVEGEQVARSEEEGEGDGGSPLLWGGLAAGGLGLAVAAGGGGGGGGGDGGGNEDPAPVPPPAEPTTVEGTVVAGPVIDGNGLSVEAFEADGTSLLGEAEVAADGTFSIEVGDYTGTVIVRVVDADSGDDHLDEASGAERDLNAALSAVVDTDGSDSTVSVNINPLTTLAAALAEREADGDAPTPDQVARSNDAIAELFGLSGLHTVTVEPINGGAYDADDGLSAGERYGAILAAFSGADLNNGGDSQQTLDDVLSGLSLSSSGEAVLSESAQAVLIQGAQTTDRETGESLSDVVASALDSAAPRITSGDTADEIPENSGAGQVVYTAAATDVGAVAWSLAAGGDAAAFSIDADTGAVTLTENPDFEEKDSYSFTVVATDAAGNSAEQAVSLSIEDQDDSAPFITSGATAEAIDENSGSGQAVYTAAADDEGPVTWSLADGGDATAFSINATTGEVTLTEDPNFETQSSYAFTVVATDADGNSSAQIVSLAINDLDETAPSITSGATADAIDENSGSGQVVYDAEATDDGPVTWSLADGGDAGDFSINATTGEVTLTEDPDFETKPTYSFTVVATDAEGNSSEQAVSLEINDVDDNEPTVTSVELTEAVDAQNDILNAGDAVRVTVTLSENVEVDTSGGTPRIALSIGGTTVFADYASGSGSSSLTFEYTIQPGDNDSNGISILPDSLESNGGSLTDSAGNPADLSHGPVASDDSFIVDTIAPTLSSSTPEGGDDNVPVGDDIVLTFSEDVQIGEGDITISDDDEEIMFDVRVDDNEVTIDPASDLDADSTYDLQIDTGAFTDAAGNEADEITFSFDTENDDDDDDDDGDNDDNGEDDESDGQNADPDVVAFDLVQGSSSDHSGRTFESDVSYDIYIRVDSDDASLSTEEDGPGTWDAWIGADNLGSDDRVILVGDGEPVEGPPGGRVNQISVDESAVAWETPSGFGAGELQERSFTRITAGDDSDVRLFETSLPASFLGGQGGQMSTMYLTSMPAGILTSQGLV